MQRFISVPQASFLSLLALLAACSSAGELDHAADATDTSSEPDDAKSGQSPSENAVDSDGRKKRSPSKSAPGSGVSHDVDSDADSVDVERDLCPNTKGDDEVDANGCALQQTEYPARSPSATAGLSEEQRSEWAKEAAARVENGAIEDNGFISFVLDPAAEFPVVLRTLAENVQETESGYELKGTVLLQVPGGEHLSLLEAEVSLGRDEESGPGLQSFEGTVRVPFPDFGVLEGVELGDPARASVGYEHGRNIEGTEAIIAEDRKHFYFHFSAGMSAELGDVSLSAGEGQAATLTLDPSDPAFFVRAAVSGLLGPIGEAGVGFSLGGHLPFSPQRTWGISSEALSFSGHLWTGGKVSLLELGLPLLIGGNTLYDLDPDEDGRTVFQDPLQGYQFGTNSELALSLSAGPLGFEIPIAQGTVVGHISKDAQYAYFSGLIEAGNDWLHGVVPIEQKLDIQSAGHLSTAIDESYFQAEGEFSIDGGTLGDWTGLSLDDLALLQAGLRIDGNGVDLTGTASGSFGPVLDLGLGTAVRAYFNGDPSGWYVSLDGDLVVSGVRLSSGAHGKVERSGVTVAGVFETPISSTEMAGTISTDGVDVRGRQDVEIPIVAGKEVIQVVSDVSICGTETVVDAALCGTEVIQDGARCGYDTVKSSVECGFESVTSAVECGETWGENGAKCGYQSITSAARCGTETVLGCLASCFLDGCDDCEVAKSCSVPKSCYVANSCEVAATCTIANTCELPKSCEKVKTCEHRVIVPDFAYGVAHVTAKLQIGTSGLTGEVVGEYCPIGGSCVAVKGGRVQVSGGTARACIEVPGVDGEFCSPL